MKQRKMKFVGKRIFAFILAIAMTVTGVYLPGNEKKAEAAVTIREGVKNTTDDIIKGVSYGDSKLVIETNLDGVTISPSQLNYLYGSSNNYLWFQVDWIYGIDLIIYKTDGTSKTIPDVDSGEGSDEIYSDEKVGFTNKITLGKEDLGDVDLSDIDYVKAFPYVQIMKAYNTSGTTNKLELTKKENGSFEANDTFFNGKIKTKTVCEETGRKLCYFEDTENRVMLCNADSEELVLTKYSECDFAALNDLTDVSKDAKKMYDDGDTSAAKYVKKVVSSNNDAFNEDTEYDFGSTIDPTQGMNISPMYNDYERNPNINFTITAYGKKGSKICLTDKDCVNNDIRYVRNNVRVTPYKYIDLDGDGDENDFVNKYVVDATLTYGGKELGSYQIVYQGTTTTFTVGKDTANSITSVALGEDAVLAVETNNYATDESQKPISITYTWYEIDSEKKETEIAYAQSSSLTVPVTDYDIQYKCVATVDFSGSRQLEYEVPFTITRKSDYQLTDIGISVSSDLDTTETCRMEADVVSGDTATLFAKCMLGDEYTASYYWTYADSYVNDDTLEVLSETNELSLEVSSADSSKFSDYYYLTVKVKDKDELLEETYVYKFHL
nr:hypothetical protein [Lachnospiraceae bacterium]